MALTKSDRRRRIKYRIRKVVTGTQEKPRLNIFRSNKQIYAQLVDDVNGVTLASASSLNKEVVEKKEINKTQQAQEVGKLVAQVAKEKGIENIVFDRNGYLYHGRIKALAEAAREGGLKF